MSNDALLKQAQNTEVETDHSEVTKGGPRLPAEGKCPARLIGYIELGVQDQGEYQGEAKDPCLEVQLVFECLGTNNEDEIEVDDGKGGKVKKTVGRILRPYPMAIKLNERANFYKMFKAMDNDRGLDHMSRMLNEVFLVTVKHGETKKKKKYAKLVSVEAPLVEKRDDMGNLVETIDISAKVRDASYPLQLFIVERPTFEMWESIKIDGTYTRKEKNEADEEIEIEVSKNFIQEKIMDSLDWDGSPMSALLLDLDGDEDEAPVEEEAEDPKKPAAKKAKAAKKPAKKEAPKEEKTDEIDADEADALLDEMEELGL